VSGILYPSGQAVQLTNLLRKLYYKVPPFRETGRGVYSRGIILNSQQSAIDIYQEALYSDKVRTLQDRSQPQHPYPSLLKSYLFWFHFKRQLVLEDIESLQDPDIQFEEEYLYIPIAGFTQKIKTYTRV